MEYILEVEDIKVDFKTYGGVIQAVRGVSFNVKHGETVAIVGESGCGKSVTAQAIFGLIPSPPGKMTHGKVIYNGKNVSEIPPKELLKVRGTEWGMISQDPMSALDPTMKIGKQITEGLIYHQGISREKANKRAIELLKLVGIPDAENRVKQYPHEFSGGMRQRVVIAIALAANPKLVIADEPTTALDVTIQAQIHDLLSAIQTKNQMSIIIITHDLGVVAEIASRAMVMYAGIVVESGLVTDIFSAPKHPYTLGLMKSLPRLDDTTKERLVPIDGVPPDLFDPPQGCPFADRCDFAMEICMQQTPPHTFFDRGHQTMCWLHDPRASMTEKFQEVSGNYVKKSS
jgi:oligopeptide/dipeptide ABC transporter ATP-binding protein